MNDQKHTPLPWKASIDCLDVCIRSDAGIIAQLNWVDDPEGEERYNQAQPNAELIETAVNAHPTLLSRAEKAEARVNELLFVIKNCKTTLLGSMGFSVGTPPEELRAGDIGDEMAEIFKEIDAAIAKCEGEK